MNISRRQGRTTLAALALSAMSILLLAGCAAGSPQQSDDSSPLVVWTDATRQAEVQKYLDANPSVKATVTVVESDSLESKLSLLNRSPEKLPDVVFTPNGDSTKFAQKLNFSADLTSKIDDETKDGFGATLSSCTQDGKAYCLPMDVSTQMLFYNKALFDQFGYTVPKTWDEYAALSAKVASEHPGYVTGSCGDGFCPNVFYRGSDCPGFDFDGQNVTVTVASDENCTRVTSMLDPLIADGSVATLSPFDPDMATIGGAQKVLMMPGFVWYGSALFDQTFKTPKGTIAVADLPAWSDGKRGAGAAVGGQWLLGSQSKHLDKGYEMIKALTTDPSLLTEQVTFPAYQPAAADWIAAQVATGFYAGDPTDVISKARNDVSGDLYAPPGAEILTSFANTVGPKLKAGSSLSSEIGPWADAIGQVLKDAGYTVTVAK